MGGLFDPVFLLCGDFWGGSRWVNINVSAGKNGGGGGGIFIAHQRLCFVSPAAVRSFFRYYVDVSLVFFHHPRTNDARLYMYTLKYMIQHRTNSFESRFLKVPDRTRER